VGIVRRGTVLLYELVAYINNIRIKFYFIYFFLTELKGTTVAQWVRWCATNPKVAGSIPDGVIGIFRCHNPSDRIVSLGSTQPLTEMSTGSISWGVKAAGA